MSRRLKVAAAQLGPVGRNEPRSSAVKRMLSLMHEAKGYGAQLVVFPELALTSFFPRWHMEDQEEIGPGAEEITARVIARNKGKRISVCIFCELIEEKSGGQLDVNAKES